MMCSANMCAEYYVYIEVKTRVYIHLLQYSFYAWLYTRTVVPSLSGLAAWWGWGRGDSSL